MIFYPFWCALPIPLRVTNSNSGEEAGMFMDEYFGEHIWAFELGAYDLTFPTRGENIVVSALEWHMKCEALSEKAEAEKYTIALKTCYLHL